MNTSLLQRLGFGALVIIMLTTAFAQADGEQNKTAHYDITGPFCGGCVGALKTSVEKIDGVHEVDIDVKELAVRITFNAEMISAEDILKHITEETTFNLVLREVKDIITTAGTGVETPCC